MRGRIALLAAMTIGLAGGARGPGDDGPPLARVRRVVFLGDSITYSGQYAAFIEAYLRARDPSLRCEFLDLGLPSETASGLSEPGHAGGQFPRPGLDERLDRVLDKARPDLVVACYGMNDGIYHPYGDERFRRFREGMQTLRDKAQAAGVKVLHVTPPVFDPRPLRGHTSPAGSPDFARPYEGYDEVLGLYSAWLLARRGNGWDVVDAHGPMGRFLARERARDPDFRLADDGVHLDDLGHWLIARQVLEHWGIPPRELGEIQVGAPILASTPDGAALLKLVRRKQDLLKDSWLTEVGHGRPGMDKGLPLPEAQARAVEVEREIRDLLAKPR